MNYQVVIPSYQRAKTLEENTLSLCVKYGIPMSSVHVFVVMDDPEHAAYLQLQCSYNFHIHYGPVGLHHMRNHITKTFPEKSLLLCIDDDIKGLLYLHIDETVFDMKSSRRYVLKELSNEMFHSWISDAFESIQSGGMFGIYPVKNGYFMKDLPAKTDDLRFCVGAMWGICNDHGIDLTLEEKEDFERTFMVYKKTGNIIRYNHITCMTTYYKTKGGMQSRGLDRIEQSRKSCTYLLSTYPEYCYPYMSKKSGVAEVRLRKHVKDS